MSTSLRRLDNAGVRLVASSGRPVDWQEQPAPDPRPYGPPADGRSYQAFHPNDDDHILEWLDATREAGVTGVQVFDELSTLMPTHSPLAMRNRARRLLQSSTSSSRTLLLSTRFPNLDADTPTTIPDDQLRAPLGETSDALTWSDFRMDIQSSVLRLLALKDREELHALLTRPWLAVAFAEYKTSPGISAELSRQDRSKNPLDDPSVRPQHAWKVQQAEKAIMSGSVRYLGDTVDKTAWVASDHDIRFIVRVALDARAAGYWRHQTSRGVWHGACTRSLWLLNWIRFLHTLGQGQGRDAQRLLQRKQEWRSILNAALQRHKDTRYSTVWSWTDEPPLVSPPSSETRDAFSPASRARSGSPSARGVSPGPPVPPAPADPASDSSSQPPHFFSAATSASGHSVPQTLPAGGIEPQRSRAVPPEYRMPTARVAHELKGISWLTQSVRTIFMNKVTARLRSWGVTTEHRGTCVLMPRDWANVAPTELLVTFSPDRCPPEQSDQRMFVSVNDINVTFARAIAWFSVWPRRGIDLDQFLAGHVADPNGFPWADMHGSHLCHHGLCINPWHIVWESWHVNFSRAVCVTTARHLRAYGSIQPQCRLHDPPCLLQHASLTTYEAICVQLHVLRRANNIPDQPALPAEVSAQRPTFESRLPLSMPCQGVSMVMLDPDNLVAGASQLSDESIVAPYSVRCSLCRSVKKWTRITSFWSHLKYKHNDVPQLQRLELVKSSAVEYQARQRLKMSDDTWARVRQALAPGFDWETFEGWRLPQDALNLPRQIMPNDPAEAEPRRRA